jgi:GAF domain-containing protein
VVVPLFVDGRVVGVLDVDSPETGRFSLDDVDFLQKAAGLVSRILPLT